MASRDTGSTCDSVIGGSMAAAQVCNRLRAEFDQVTVQPLPDRLQRLADQLERAYAGREPPLARGRGR